jgi:hypothetical protein
VAKVTITDRDLGMKAAMQVMQRLKIERPHVVVGITGEAGSKRMMSREDADAMRRHKQRVKQRKKSKTNKPERWKPPPPPSELGLSIVEIGAIHEFGAGNVPERSFLRATVDLHQKKYQRYLTKGLRREVMQAAAGKQASGESITLKRAGLMAEGDIKKRIASGINPPLSPITIARKKSSVPLIDTGQLRASIASELRKGRG